MVLGEYHLRLMLAAYCSWHSGHGVTVLLGEVGNPRYELWKLLAANGRSRHVLDEISDGGVVGIGLAVVYQRG